MSQLTSKVNVQDLQAQFEKVRMSQYFPAVLGAVAGGLTGAVMAGLIASRTERKVVVTEKLAEDGSAKGTMLLGFSLGEIMQLVTVVASLARQLKDWRDQSSY